MNDFLVIKTKMQLKSIKDFPYDLHHQKLRSINDTDKYNNISNNYKQNTYTIIIQ